MGFRWPEATFFMWTSLPFVLCGLPLRTLNRRSIFMVTGLGSVFGSDRGRARFARMLADRVFPYLFRGVRSRVIVHNAEDKEFLVAGFGVPRKNVQVTPGCGVDPTEFPWLEELPRGPRPVIYAPVRLIREKGVSDAVRASALLLDQGIEHEMWFSSSIDEGNPASLTQMDLNQMQQTSRAVRFLGYQSDVMSVYRQCSIVCIPTKYREGLPTALLEAASCGRPIVATNNVGCREFVSHERTGLVVPRGQAPELAAALARVIQDRDLAEDLRKRAHRRFLDGFTKSVMVERTLEVVDDLARSRPRNPRRGPRTAAEEEGANDAR
jgi:glycosyltransferase involved in cell wall biosynthesis